MFDQPRRTTNVLQSLTDHGVVLAGAEHATLTVRDPDVAWEPNVFTAPAGPDRQPGAGMARLAMAIRSESRFVGRLEVERCGDPFTTAHARALEHLITLASAALDHADVPAVLAGSIAEEAAALARSMRACSGGDDDGLAEACLCRDLATELGLTAAEAEEAALAALLHPVGLACVDEASETYAQAGSEIISHVPGYEAVALIVLYHGEPYDQPGGCRTPVGSRIVGACRAFRRSRRSGAGRDESIARLRAVAGVYDPVVIDAVERCVEHDGTTLVR